ncbi:MAG: hypothetical protein AAGB04_13340, partial [Pseudomonadota bacterium]
SLSAAAIVTRMGRDASSGSVERQGRKIERDPTAGRGRPGNTNGDQTSESRSTRHVGDEQEETRPLQSAAGGLLSHRNVEKAVNGPRPILATVAAKARSVHLQKRKSGFVGLGPFADSSRFRAAAVQKN